LTHTI